MATIFNNTFYFIGQIITLTTIFYYKLFCYEASKLDEGN